MQVISVDPAPKKEAVQFDGRELRSIPAGKLAAHCRQLALEKSVLLCWDAPLTGPPNPDDEEAAAGAYSQRIIESFFSREETGYKVKSGISVLPYAGCPHWAITRSCIGLPRVGRFDAPHENLPFQLVHDGHSIREGGRWVVETHPAVAVWLWCQTNRTECDTGWIYKGSKRNDSVLGELWPILLRQWETYGVAEISQSLKSHGLPKTDDAFDAIVGWVLGTLLVKQHPGVDILGDESTGSFALPIGQALRKKFGCFKESRCAAH